MQHVMEKHWIGPRGKVDNVIKQLLINRGIEKDQDDYLNPSYEKLLDPFLMKGIEEATEKIINTLEKKEKIGIFGDYDADGIPATVLVWDVLQKHGAEVETFIPRRQEGYGMSARGLDYFERKGVKLIITVDLGVTARKEIEYAKKLGMDTIVTDHHETIEGLLPENIPVIDPKQPDCKYPYKELSGAAVAFKLMQALSYKTKKISENQLKWYLDLVGISTFCDLVPLTGENRILAKYGMMVIAKTKRLGLQKMLHVAGVEAKINPYTIGYVIGPRINASGRMGDCSDSLELLRTSDSQEALRLAKDLEKKNSDRQNLLTRTIEEADNIIIKKGLDKNKVILVCKQDWSEGIVGLVAGRLLEKYNRPVIVLGSKDSISVGSARSLGNFSIKNALDCLGKYLIKYGGHAKAAGLTIENDRVEDFYGEILKLANLQITDDDLIPKIYYDLELQLEVINSSLLHQISSLEPFGMGNPKPVFASYGVECIGIKRMGKAGEHARLVVKESKKELSAVIFGRDTETLGVGNKIDILYTLEEDNWMGKGNLQLKIIDFRISSEAL